MKEPEDSNKGVFHYLILPNSSLHKMISKAFFSNKEAAKEIISEFPSIMKISLSYTKSFVYYFLYELFTNVESNKDGEKLINNLLLKVYR